MIADYPDDLRRCHEQSRRSSLSRFIGRKPSSICLAHIKASEKIYESRAKRLWFPQDDLCHYLVVLNLHQGESPRSCVDVTAYLFSPLEAGYKKNPCSCNVCLQSG